MAILGTAGVYAGIRGADDGAQHRAVDDGAGGRSGLQGGGQVLFIFVHIQSIQPDLSGTAGLTFILNR